MKEATKTNEIYGSAPRGTLGVRRSGLASVIIIIIIIIVIIFFFRFYFCFLSFNRATDFAEKEGLFVF